MTSGTVIVIAMLARTCWMLSALINPKSMARSTIILTVSLEWQRALNGVWMDEAGSYSTVLKDCWELGIARVVWSLVVDGGGWRRDLEVVSSAPAIFFEHLRPSCSSYKSRTSCGTEIFGSLPNSMPTLNPSITVVT